MWKEISAKTIMSKKNKTDNSPRVSQREKISFDLSIREFNWSEKQRALIATILDKKTKIVFIDGPAGTGKTLLSVYCALQLLKHKSVSEMLYIRTLAESASKGMGFLPGEAGDKFGPFMGPLMDKLDELLPKQSVDLLIKDQRVKGMPVNFLRGASFNAKFAIFDEFQNANYQETVTSITRIGEFTKFIFLGDIRQSDIGSKSAFQNMFTLFDDEESRESGIYCVKLTSEDIVRSKILKFIAARLESVTLR